MSVTSCPVTPELTKPSPYSGALHTCDSYVLGIFPAPPLASIVSLGWWSCYHCADASYSPDQCNLHEIRTLVEQLAALLVEGT